MVDVSPALGSAWAKADADGWLSVVGHAADACAVAGWLFDGWLSGSVREILGAGRSPAQARALVRWAAAVHDVGKLSPAFACQNAVLADRLRASGLPIAVLRSDRSRGRFPHSVVGFHVVASYLQGRGWCDQAAWSLAVVVGGHHGVPPDSVPARPPRLMFGGSEWDAVRAEFMEFAAQISGANTFLDRWADHPLSAQQQAALTGVVVVADWIASNSRYFPLNPAGCGPVAAVAPRERGDGAPVRDVAAAMGALGLPGPWRPEPVSDLDGAFARFGVPGATVNSVQVAAAGMAERIGPSGLVVVESVMGSGKTEGALLAAERFAAAGGFGGLAVLLPTMASSNAMFDRVMRWLEAQPAAAGSVMLAHGKAYLHDRWRGLVDGGSVVNVGCDCAEGDSGVIGHQWLSGAKKGLLANFVVGTIDQLLFMALKSRYLVLRHLAFTGKVVVIDEVHAADEYMGEYLCRALEWLGAYRVPVVLLSATLPPALRAGYVEAYARGLGVALRDAEVLQQQGYPVVFGVGADGRVLADRPATHGPSVSMRLERIDDDDQVLIELLAGALAGGGVAAVVRNTVSRAQATARALREVFGDADVRLLHSGFVASHRSRLEDGLVDQLGREGVRPQRLIVVGTQVIEQSLDIDVDVMISDVAPVDLLLQRAGRMHRHPRPRPAGLEAPRLVLTGVEDWSAPVPVPVVGSQRVYEHYDLLRAIAVLAGQDSIRLPDDVPRLVAAAYAEDFATPPGWDAALDETRHGAQLRAAQRRARAAEFRIWAPDARPDLVGWLAYSGTDADDPRGYARVRDSLDSIEVVLTRRIDDRMVAPVSAGGLVLARDATPADDVARAVLGSAVRLPRVLSVSGAVIEEIAGRMGRYSGWQSSKWLKGELVLELDEHGSTRVGGFTVTYDERDGLVVTR